jgi:hypothetical protein
MKPLVEVFDHWLVVPELDGDALASAESGLEQFIEEMLRANESALAQDPHAAMQRLMVHLAFVNALVAGRPMISATVTQFLPRYQAFASALAKVLGARSVTLGLGTSPGLMIGFTW